MAKYAEIIDRATQLAEGVANAPNPQPDRSITAEAIFPHAVRAEYREQAKTGRHLDNLTIAYPIEIKNNKGDLPAGILRQYLDRSTVVNVPLASRMPFEDLQRFRRDNLSVGYAIRDAKLFCVGAVPVVITRPLTTATAGSITISGDASSAAVGDRVYLYDDTNGLIADAYIASINGTANFTITGKTLAATYLTNERRAIIYDGQDDESVRTFTDLETTINSATVESETAAFTSADEGRRLRVYETDTTTVVVDAIIQSVTDENTAILGAKALSTQAASDAEILFSPLILQAIGIPDLPADICESLELVPDVADNVVVRIAEVLRGDMPLEALVRLANG